MIKYGLAGLFVFLGGFAVMVLEIVGARLLAITFGSSFYVWTSQIGVILLALAMGYFFGGILADKLKRMSFLFWVLAPTGIATFFIPAYAPKIMDAIFMRHPLGKEVPGIWVKLDPAIGSAAIFLIPCFVLATLSPYLIRLLTSHVDHVGKSTGLIYGASTVGSIAGVFCSGYILIDYMKLTSIFQATGAFILLLGISSLFLGRWFDIKS